MKDLVVGCITNYDWDSIKYWVNSLDRSGYEGDKIVICYNIPFSVANELVKRNYIICSFTRNDSLSRLEYQPIETFNICVRRFFHQWKFLNSLPNKQQYRYVVATDVKDVVFQKNPSVWLEQNLGEYSLNVSSECIRYKDEVWGDNNLRLSFGDDIHSFLRENIIYNAGVLSGTFSSFIEMSLQIFLMCNGLPEYIPGGGGPDQAALNVLLGTSAYKNITKMTKSSEGWAAQLGTTMIEKFAPFLVEPSPVIRDGNVYTSTGIEYSIVHQYDRIQHLSDIIRQKYS